MKKLIYFSLVLAMFGCQEKYEFNTNFETPTQLAGPQSVKLDVTSNEPIILNWEGGHADDGGILLYNVVIDREDGDFTHPLDTLKSDLGGLPRLTLTHAALNTLARNAGIRPEQTGILKWSVLTSKGGQTKITSTSARLSVTRGEGIDNIPQQLYLFGTGAETDGSQFRKVSDGVFQIYTRLKDGELMLKSTKSNDAFIYTTDNSAKLKEDNASFSLNPSQPGTLTRITVDFNTLKVSSAVINEKVRCIWGATFNNIAELNYRGNGIFEGEGDIRFIDKNRPETNPPSWLSWIEERYYFIANVDGKDKCWGRGDDVSPERPTGNETSAFYSIYETDWDQWSHLWKMKGDYDLKHATITIDTNANGLMIHKFSNIRPI